VHAAAKGVAFFFQNFRGKNERKALGGRFRLGRLRDVCDAKPKGRQAPSALTPLLSAGRLVAGALGQGTMLAVKQSRGLFGSSRDSGSDILCAAVCSGQVREYLIDPGRLPAIGVIGFLHDFAP
jgi:hypothetical protein